MRIQRIATDVRARVKSGKFNSLTGIKNCRNKIRGSKAISHTNINIDINEAGTKGNLNKSIESHNNYSAKYRLSRTSDISQRRKQKTKNRDTMPINRINMNKKDVNNPFYNFES